MVEAVKALGPASMSIDGEAVILDDQGRSDFNLLQSSLGAVGRREGKDVSPAIMYASSTWTVMISDGPNTPRGGISSKRSRTGRGCN